MYIIYMYTYMHIVSYIYTHICVYHIQCVYIYIYIHMHMAHTWHSKAFYLSDAMCSILFNPDQQTHTPVATGSLASRITGVEDLGLMR